MERVSTQQVWQALFLTQAGSSHEEFGRPCQDAVAARRNGSLLCLAVADGAGSTELGGVGAETAVRAAMNWLKSDLPSPIDPNWPRHFRRGFRQVRAAVGERAKQLDVSIDELATTCLCAVVTPGHAIAGHVGDGACILRLAGGGYQLLSVSERDGFANETDFITQKDFSLHLRLSVYRGTISGVVALTDGLEAGALKGKDMPYPGFLDPLFDWCRAEPHADGFKRFAEFLKSDSLRSHTDDDCSLVIGTLQEKTK